MDTETAQLADVLLPAAIWGEKTGCMTNAERRCTLLTKAVDPPEEARPDFDIFVDFARRMNLRDRHGQPLIGVDTPEAAFDEWREVSRGCIPDYSGMSYRRLRETGGLQWPCTEKKPDGTIRLYEEPRFPTHWRIAESYEKDIATGHERSLQEYRDRSDDAGRASFVATHYEPATEGPDAKHELIVTSGRLAHHWHTRSKSARAPMLAAAAPQAFITMNVDDARARGIEDGDRVRLTSRRGVVEAQAKVGNVAPPGVVFMPFHFGELGDEHSPNNLMPRTWDPVSQQPVQKLAFVDLQRVDVAESAPWWRPDKA